MNELLLAIQTKLDEVQELKYKDENWGQLDLYGPEIPVQWPCALVALSSGNFSNTGSNYRAIPMNRQEGGLTIELTIANIKLTKSSGRAPMSQKTKAFEIWETVENVHKIIQGWSPAENAGKLIRTGFGSVRRDDGVQEIRVTYSLGLHDC